MDACETCWNEAAWRSQARGGTQLDHYQDLLAEHPEHDTPAAETGTSKED